MSDLIDRDAVMLRVREFIGNPTYNENMLVNDLNALPSEEPERKKGEWMMHSDYPDRLICSDCTGQFDVWHWESKQMHFCPNCGADMRGE